MTLEDLKRDLGAILAEEERPSVDWKVVEALCLEAIAGLGAEPAHGYPHEVVYHFLDDPDVRRRDLTYASRQRQRLREWLSTEQ